jgi:acyl dehydratase
MTELRLQPAALAELVGQEIGASSWITLDQSRIDEFAHCTGDTQWIHVDVDRAARESPFGGTIAHGFLTLSLLAPTAFDVLLSRVEAKQAVNYGLDKVRFLAPVPAGKRVRNHIRIVAVENKGGGRVLLTTENAIHVEGGDKPALVAQSLAMLIS